METHDFRSPRWGHNLDMVQTSEERRRLRKPVLWARGAGWSTPKPQVGDELIYASVDHGDRVVKITEIRPAPGVIDMFFWKGQVQEIES